MLVVVGSNANNQSHESCQKAIISDTAAQQYYNVGDLASAGENRSLLLMCKCETRDSIIEA